LAEQEPRTCRQTQAEHYAPNFLNLVTVDFVDAHRRTATSTIYLERFLGRELRAVPLPDCDLSTIMKSLIKKERRPGLWLEDVPKPEVGINDVLIRINRTGICGTDLHIYKWDAWAQKTIPVPMVVGHEFVGEIFETGSNVSDFHSGDLVSGEGHVVCGRCRNCMAGRRQLCADTKGVGVNRPGAFAEFLSLPMTNVWHHAPGIDLDVASIFDPFGNAVHTALSFPLLGEDVLITGAGPIGIMAAAVARHAGARFVVVTDVNDYRLRLARQMGATVAHNVKGGNLREVQRQLGMKEGFDVGLEMSGSPLAFREMLDNMCHGGKIAMLGSPAEPMPIDWNKVVFNMLTIRGIYGREMYETWYQMTVMLESGLNIKPVITHRFHYTEFEQGFAAMLSGQSGKVILDWTTK
jgi:threonine 3-dehydrogenase